MPHDTAAMTKLKDRIEVQKTYISALVKTKIQNKGNIKYFIGIEPFKLAFEKGPDIQNVCHCRKCNWDNR